jgi:hypothetical protein
MGQKRELRMPLGEMVSRAQSLHWQPGQPRALQQVLVISLRKEATLLLPPPAGLLVQFQQASDRRPGFLDLPDVGECTTEKKSMWGGGAGFPEPTCAAMPPLPAAAVEANGRLPATC